jgi:8-oxo-dGTP pyrophosphatase MutT (NUDIX family)
MIKIFINEKSVLFIEKPEDFVPDPGNILLESLEKEPLLEAVARFESDPAQKRLYVVGKDTEKSFRKFCSIFIALEAGGGLVMNAEGNYLFIYRRGKWDLPKGKSEKGEPISDTALREVREETGLEEIKVMNSVGVTYHAYHEADLFFLKKTYWFGMMHLGNKKPIPQVSEDITRIKWLGKEEIGKVVLKNTFPSIAGLLVDYLGIAEGRGDGVTK